MAKGATPTFLLLYLKFYTLWRVDFYCFIVSASESEACVLRGSTHQAVIWISLSVSARPTPPAERKTARVEGAVHEAGELCAPTNRENCVSAQRVYLLCLLSSASAYYKSRLFSFSELNVGCSTSCRKMGIIPPQTSVINTRALLEAYELTECIGAAERQKWKSEVTKLLRIITCTAST